MLSFEELLLSQPELRNGFEGFCRRMGCTWHFLNEGSETFSHINVFWPKLSLLLPKGHVSLEIFLSQLEKEPFKNELDDPLEINFSAEELKT